MSLRFVPKGEVSFQYSRSSGPGGQHVNKTNSRATLRWTPSFSALPESVKTRFISLYASQLTTEGELLISSDRFRKREQNIADCLARLDHMIERASRPPKKRVATKPTRNAIEKRLTHKHLRSERKRSRRLSNDD